MKIKRDKIYDALKNMDILLEKSFEIIPGFLSAVNIVEVNKILIQIYDCIPEELKNEECSVYNLLKQFEFLSNNSFQILPKILVAVEVRKLVEIIDKIYASMPSAFSSVEISTSIEETLYEQIPPSTKMKFLIFLGRIIKLITPMIQIAVISIIFIYFWGNK